MVGIDKFDFPIDFVTLGMEEDQQMSSIGTPSNAISETWIDIEHPWKTIENVMVGIDKFDFPIDFVTLGMEEDQQMSSIGTPSNATSETWIDIEHEEMTLLVGKKKLKFNLHQSI